MEKDIDYAALSARLTALVEDVPHLIANLANASALLYQEIPDLNWAGFYLLEGEQLVLGPFQGKPACIEIPLGRGVCGTAAQTGRPQLVPDVHAFPGHIACDSVSNSEIVVPLYCGGRLWGVLDLDSPTLNRFGQRDLEGLTALCREMEKALGALPNCLLTK